MRLAAAVLALILAPGAAASPAPGDELIGRPAPPLVLAEWLNTDPLTLDGLRGKVVLLRWWTAPGCSFCAATAPSLNALHQRFGPRGLVVIGIYHHKAGGEPRPAEVARYAEGFGFTFPVAIDRGWSNLRQWWPAEESGWTSVSFLLDRHGIVRWVHPGGAYPPESEEYRDLQAAIELLLAES